MSTTDAIKTSEENELYKGALSLVGLAFEYICIVIMPVIRC